MKEEWKDIKGYEGLYQVSNLGNVKSLARQKKNRSKEQMVSERIRKPENTRLGYLRISLYKDGAEKRFLIHRLVAEAFLEQREGLEVNHKDGNKQNNMVDNLEWCTRSENQRHAFKTGLNKGSEIQPKNLVIEFNGESLTLSQWARKQGIKAGTLWRRLKNGWDIEHALMMAPLVGRNQNWRKEMLK